MYQAQRISSRHFVPIRGLHYHLRVWGKPGSERAPLVLLHGWMDVGASWQFVVDALREDRWIVAPDWRGFGLTRREGPPVDWYPFADYLGDLDALLDHLAGDQPVDLVGHSMGGNIATAYAGIRPARVRRLVNLEGVGMAASAPQQAPGRYAQWLNEIRTLRAGDMDLQTYDSPEGVARRLMKTNPRLSTDQAHWLAREWAAPNEAGRWVIQGDAAHKVVNPMLYQAAETVELYRHITAPTLSVTARHTGVFDRWQGRFTLEHFHERIRQVPHLREAVVDDAAHMLHHDQPETVARLIEDFINGA